jgi:ABC-2 type transport system permease protein
VQLPHTIRPAAWRGYWRTGVLAAGNPLSDGPLFLIDYLIRILRVVLLVSIWRTVIGPAEQVGGMTLNAVLTYTLVAAAFAPMLDLRTELVWTIWNGNVVSRWLQPIGMPGLYASEKLGESAFGLATFALPLLIVAPLLGIDPRPATPAHGALFVLSLALGVTVGVAIDFLFGALMLFMSETLWGIEQLRNAVGALLSGVLLPLQLYPWGLGELFGWLPFAAVGSAPLRVYTGTGDVALLLGSQVAWAVALWPLALWAWRANRERMASMGG